jgi:pyruvate carboxylase subunit B
MAKKYIDVMDTTFRDGFQSVFGGRVLIDDYLPAVEAAKKAGITHFEFAGGANFQTSFYYLQQNAFETMDKFRSVVGENANLQAVSRGINTLAFEPNSKEMIELFAKLFNKHGTNTVRNFDPLNDINNLAYPAQVIKQNGMDHEITITIMDAPAGCKEAHGVMFYENKIREILDAGIDFDSLCFKDATGTSNPNKVYQIISMARKLLGESTHLRFHTHETAGVSVASYIAALEAGANGIDLAVSPVSGGTSQPDILTMLHAIKGTDYNLSDLKFDKVLKYQSVLKECLQEYRIPLESIQVSPLINLSPMPGSALVINTEMMKEEGNYDKFDEVAAAMKDVVSKGGFASSATPVSQIYWQQAYANVMFGEWEKITPNYGKLVLGYYGKTPVEPDLEIVKLAAKELDLEPNTKPAIEIASLDETQSIAYWSEKLKNEGLEDSDENIFIAAICEHDKGIEFLKGNSPLKIRKGKNNNCSGEGNMAGNYTVVVDGKTYSVQVAEGNGEVQIVAPVENTQSASTPAPQPAATPKPAGGKGSLEIHSQTPGNVWKILKKPGDSVAEGEVIMILEAMKMEIDIAAPQAGVIATIDVEVNDAVADGQLLATME